MNLLFLSLLDFDSIEERNIYTDLLREFRNHKYHVYAISPSERRKGKKTFVVNEDGTSILKLRIGNIQKVNLIEKGISTLSIESKFIKGIRKYFSNVKFDLVLYSTPPITFCNVIQYVKRRDGACTYLMLKDIFPQNAVDIGILSTTGVKGIVYQYFRKREKKLYAISDRIGCMSQANVDYIVQHNPSINADIVEICPNSVEVVDMSVDVKTRESIRKKYNLPLDKLIFVYGGNLGKPQGIPFLIQCIKSQKENGDVFFLIVGDGTEYHLLDEFVRGETQKNVKLMKHLPKEEFDILVGACDVGMIFLDHRFTIPNFPSRLLSYMQAKIPVLAVTDTATDIGKVIVENGFGWWCESNDVNYFSNVLSEIMTERNAKRMSELIYGFLLTEYSTSKCYKIITEALEL